MIGFQADTSVYAFQSSKPRKILDPIADVNPGSITRVRKRVRQRVSVVEEDGKSDLERFIASVQMLWAIKSFGYRSEVSKRLHKLRHSCIEDGIDLSIESLGFFIDFIRVDCPRSLPQIAVTDSGNLRATWRKSKHEHFAIEFLGNKLVKFVLFAENEGLDTTRIAGAIPIGQIPGLIKQLKIFWI